MFGTATDDDFLEYEVRQDIIHELDELCDRALACRSEEEAFEIIERLRPYLTEMPSTGKAHRSFSDYS
jgi:hypothetical protein